MEAKSAEEWNIIIDRVKLETSAQPKTLRFSSGTVYTSLRADP